ncbi:MAG: hypothetical protein OXI79_06330 [Gammaproteobacteria bacterium]|nr:hypothetical protein [Gammaproteobacteria bacterium]
MAKYRISLTEEEAALCATIDLRVRHESHDEGRAAYLANREPILGLLRSLRERDGIPEERMRYWLDPEYNTGRLKASHKGVFEQNGRQGAEIYEHPHFVPYLRYFLFGAELPDPVIAAFEEAVGNPEWVTSGDIVPMGTRARGLAREYQLERREAAEEFFKLCLDMGLGVHTAASVRSAVMRLS